MKSIAIEKSKMGIPCLWECGGGWSNTGSAQIIANADGTPPNALYIRQSGQLACKEHALIPIRLGMFVISASHHRGDFDTVISVIANITDNEAVLQETAIYSDGQWNTMLPLNIAPAIEAAAAKAQDYHCRSVYWAAARQ